MRTILVAVIWLIASTSALAAGWSARTVPQIAHNGGGKHTVSPGPTGGSGLAELMHNRTFTPRGAPWTGGAIMRDLLKGPALLRGGDGVPLKIERVVDRAAVARGFAKALPIIGTAIAIKEVLDVLECSNHPGNGAIWCPGEYGEGTPSGEYSYRWQWEANVPGNWYPTASAAIAYIINGTKPTCHNPPSMTCDLVLLSGPTYAPGALVGLVRISKTGTSMQYCGPPEGYYCSLPIAPQVLELNLVRGNPTTGLVCQGQILDGLCREVVPYNEVPPYIEEHPESWPKLAGVPPALDAGGIDYDTADPQISGPSRAPGGRVGTETRQDGTIVTTDRDFDIEYSPGPQTVPWYDVEQRDTVREWPPSTSPTPYVPPDTDGNGGSTNDPPPSGTTTVTTTTTNVDIETCGLPGTPPCKIDETGTPNTATPLPTQDLDQAKDSLIGKFGDLGIPAPEWTWSFSFPSGCSVIALPAFAPWLTQIDVCQFQPVVHDLMSLAWIAATIFGCVAMVGAALRGS